MTSRGFACFDTALGACGLAWSDDGVTRIRLPATDGSAATMRAMMAREVPGVPEAAPPPVKAQLTGLVGILEDIMLLQIRIGIMFAILVSLGVMARTSDPGFHKRMMILSIAGALPAAFDRMTWIPTTLPGNPLSSDLYVLLALSPMFLWDVLRNRGVHRAYWVWLAVAAPLTIAVHTLWDTPVWHATAKRLMGV